VDEEEDCAECHKRHFEKLFVLSLLLEVSLSTDFAWRRRKPILRCFGGKPRIAVTGTKCGMHNPWHDASGVPQTVVDNNEQTPVARDRVFKPVNLAGEPHLDPLVKRHVVLIAILDAAVCCLGQVSESRAASRDVLELIHAGPQGPPI
jgi:hypothetical protein